MKCIFWTLPHRTDPYSSIAVGLYSGREGGGRLFLISTISSARLRIQPAGMAGSREYIKYAAADSRQEAIPHLGCWSRVGFSSQ